MAIKKRKALEESIRKEIDRLWHEANNRIQDMESLKENPLVASAITKNRGYMLALEDLTEFILKVQ